MTVGVFTHLPDADWELLPGEARTSSVATFVAGYAGSQCEVQVWRGDKQVYGVTDAGDVVLDPDPEECVHVGTGYRFGNEPLHHVAREDPYLIVFVEPAGVPSERHRASTPAEAASTAKRFTPAGRQEETAKQRTG